MTNSADCNGNQFPYIPLENRHTFLPDDSRSVLHGTLNDYSASDVEDMCDCRDCKQSPSNISYISESDDCLCCDCNHVLQPEDFSDDAVCCRDNSPGYDGGGERSSRSQATLDSRRSAKYSRLLSPKCQSDMSAPSVPSIQQKPHDSSLAKDIGVNGRKAMKPSQRSYKFCGRVLSMPPCKASYRNVTLSLPKGCRDTEVITKEIKPQRIKDGPPRQTIMPKLKIAFRKSNLGDTSIETSRPVDTHVRPPRRSQMYSTRYSFNAVDSASTHK